MNDIMFVVSITLTTHHQIRHGQLFPGEIPGELDSIIFQGPGQGQFAEDIPEVGVGRK